MMREKVLPVVGVILSCLAASVILSCLAGAVKAQNPQTPEGFDQQIQAAREQGAMVFVAYKKENGEPFAIIEAPGYRVFAQSDEKKDGDDVFSKKFIKVLKDIEKEMGKKVVEAKATPSYFVHGSGGCQIMVTASGRYKVVCP
jgi:hypothetical protein